MNAYVPCALKPKGTPIKANPHPGELHRIMFAQSAATRGGVVPDAREIIQSMPAVTEKHDSPSRAVAACAYSTREEWEAYYAGNGPCPTLPPF